MRNTHPMSITLPHSMAEMVKAKVTSGEYATESEVIRDGLRALQARDSAVENWLKHDVAKSYDEHRASPNGGIPANKLLSRLKTKHQARKAKA